MKEVNELLNRLGELEDAPLIWINKKVYDMAQEIKRLKEEYVMLQNASSEVEEEKDKEIERLNKENSDLQNIANIEISKSEFLEKEIERLNKKLQLISDEFLKYDWETSSKGQTINQLKSLYYSIFKGGE